MTMKKLIVRRPGLRPGPHVDDAKLRGAIDGMVEEAVDRLTKLTGRDGEFVRRFGRWTRPSRAPRYPIVEWATACVRWDPRGDGVVDVERFLNCFPEKSDRIVIGEIARFVVEEVMGKFATDETLRVFRLSLCRRLDSVGF
jgi:hypothetical protein